MALGNPVSKVMNIASWDWCYVQFLVYFLVKSEFIPVLIERMDDQVLLDEPMHVCAHVLVWRSASRVVCRSVVL